MKNLSLPLTSSFIIVAFIVGTTFGYYISPTYQNSMYEKDMMGLGKADSFVDLRYLNAMITHHQGAILLANQVKDKTTRSEIRALASEILVNEPNLILELQSWKKDWYNDSSLPKDPIVPNLGSHDEKIDLRFLNALISHHEEGVSMTKEIKTKSSRNEILNNADTVETFLTNSLRTLQSWRYEWYAIQE